MSPPVWPPLTISGGMPDMFKSLAPYILFNIPQTIQSCRQLFNSAFSLFNRGLGYLKSIFYYDIPEKDGINDNVFFSSVKLYLGNIATISPTIDRVTLSLLENSTTFTYGLSPNNCITDTFKGKTVSWEYSVSRNSENRETRKFILYLSRKEKDLVLPAYLDHIMVCANKLRSRSRELLLSTNAHGDWSSVIFRHPSTFDTLVIDPSKKEEIIADLREFADHGGEFYQRTGRPWKRGYLLYGPPGTGKSSMIAAMANYLRYDIYDIELTHVNSNSDLWELLMNTASKSIIVIEDIDCSLNLTRTGKEKSAALAGRGKSSITLSGLLNFCDGLWSFCGSERIFIFTTNHIQNVDPALLRSWRMDMRIHMGYCSFTSLKTLMKNYLGFKEGDEKECHEIMGELEGVIEDEAITPADVGELLSKKRRRKMTEAVAELLEELKGRIKRRKKRGGKDEGMEEEANEDWEEGPLTSKQNSESRLGDTDLHSRQNHGQHH